MKQKITDYLDEIYGGTFTATAVCRPASGTEHQNGRYVLIQRNEKNENRHTESGVLSGKHS
ncbi:hypothetical protein ACVD2C_03700, partial [Escherichia coli]